MKSRGFNAVRLTPIFTNPSHHGYDISDYYQVNPRLGSLEDFRWLLDRAHQLDMKVILDFVANHCSSQHPFFVDAVRDPHSRYHDYFVWKQWPQYACFYNIQTMPKFNLAYGSPARDYLLESAQYWLSLGVDGFRLDYAHGPEQDFWVDFRQACTQFNPEHWTFAEIVQPADVQASYAGGVGGTLDFLLCQAIRLTFGQQTWCLSQFCGFLQHHFDYFPKDFSLPAFIDNHDMNRFLVAANNDDRLLRLALLVLYVLPGAPIIYYGTEVPINQAQSIHAKNAQGFDEARLPMPWEAMEHSTLPDYLQKLAQFRHAYPDIHQTGWEVYLCDDQREMLVLKKKASYEFFLFINRSPREEQFSIRVESKETFLDLITEETYLSTSNHLTVMVEPRSAQLLTSGGAFCSG
jgi:glycosidase